MDSAISVVFCTLEFIVNVCIKRLNTRRTKLKTYKEYINSATAEPVFIQSEFTGDEYGRKYTNCLISHCF